MYNFSCQLSDNFYERLDCEWHNPSTIKKFDEFRNSKSENRKLIVLNKIAEVKGGKRLPKGTLLFNTERDVIPYVRAIDVRNNEVDVKNCQKISPEIHQKIQNYQIRKGDLLLTIVGATIGKIGLLGDEVEICNFTENLAKIRLFDDNVSNRFILLFLDSQLGKLQTDRYSVGALQYKLSLDSCRKLEIYLPFDKSKKIFDLKEQEKILQNYDKNWSVFKRKFLDYDSCLKKITNIAEKTLRIDNNISNKNSTIKSEKDIKDRLDCYSLSYDYNKIIEYLKNKANLVNPLSAGKLNIVKDTIKKEEFEQIKTNEFRYIEIGSLTKQPDLIMDYKEDILINLPTRAKQVVKENDILIPRPIGSTEKITLVNKQFEDNLCSTGFIIIRTGEYDESCLLVSLLKSDIVQKQMFYLQSGSLQPEITPKNFRKIILPYPKNKNDRLKIISEFKETLKEANSLRKEFITSRKKAKEDFLKEALAN